MNPQARPSGEDPASWGRFDVVGHRVVYGGVPAEAAYAESLASFRVAHDVLDTLLSELLAGTSGKEASKTLVEQVREEWEHRGHMTPGKVPAGWRQERRLYKLTLPADGWFIDVSHSDSLAALSRALSDTLMPDFAMDQITIGDVLGEKRAFTTALAEWVWQQTLDDGRLPHGIVFPSKHGDDYKCYAVFLRARGDGKPITSEPTKSDDGQEIKAATHNSALRKIMMAFDLRGF